MKSFLDGKMHVRFGEGAAASSSEGEKKTAGSSEL
jgi:hypothetical protein